MTSHQMQARSSGLTAAGHFWYILSCIAFGAGYFTKIPAKKAMADFGLCRLTGAEAFWYVLMCIPFGAGYLAKVPTLKALSELHQFRAAPPARLAPHERAIAYGNGAVAARAAPALEAAPPWQDEPGELPAPDWPQRRSRGAEWPEPSRRDRPQGRHGRG